MALARIVTYNIFMGGRKGSPLTDAVRQMGPDVLLVNECPKAPLIWSWQCLRLVNVWQMLLVAGGRPAGSNLIAATDRVSVESAGSERIPQPLFQPRRGVAWAQVRIGGQLLGVVACHLSLDPGRHQREVERVIAIAGRLDGPIVVGGDLNEPPTGPAWRRLREAGFEDHGSKRWLTFPAGQPRKRIDALLVRGPAAVVHHGDAGLDTELIASASDHRPVLLEVEL
jgi:endonuclease/exonuclease/phosphatase family metal-dependent hydrolase